MGLKGKTYKQRRSRGYILLRVCMILLSLGKVDGPTMVKKSPIPVSKLKSIRISKKETSG